MIVWIVLASPVAAQGRECPLDVAPDYAGIVVDMETGVPLSGADVLLTRAGGAEPRARTRTGPRGDFALCETGEPGPVLLQAVYRGRAGDRLRLPAPRSSVRLTVDAATSELDGRVLDETGGPLAEAAVSLVGTPIAATTDRRGRFHVSRLPPGSYEILVTRDGFIDKADSITVEHAAVTELSIRMVTEPHRLEPVVVAVRSRELERVGFYHRAQSGSGVFVTRADLREMPWRFPSDFLRGVAGVQVVPGAAYGNRVVGRLNCPFNYVLHGQPVAMGFEIDELDFDAIEALEIYRGPNEVPAEFAPMSRAVRGRCGVIAIWLRVR